MRRSNSLAKSHNTSSLNIKSSWHPLSDSVSPVNLEDSHTTPTIHPNPALDPESLQESLNPFYKHFTTSSKYADIRTSMLNNDSIVLALPILSQKEALEIDISTIDSEVDNYILFFESTYDHDSSFNTRFTCLSGFYGFIDPARLYVQGKLLETDALLNLEFNELEKLNSLDTSLSKPTSLNSAINLFEVLDEQNCPITIKYILKKKSPYASDQFLNLLFLSNRIQSQNLVSPHSLFKFPVPNTVPANGLLEPKDTIPLPARKTAKSPDNPTASFARSNSSTPLPQDSLDLSIPKFIKIKLACLQILCKFRIDHMDVVGGAIHNYQIDSAIESFISASADTHKKLCLLIKKRYYLGPQPPNPQLEPPQSGSQLLADSDAHSFTKLPPVGLAWNTCFDNLTDTIHAVLSAGYSTYSPLTRTSSTTNHLDVVNSIVAQLALSISRISLNWIYGDAVLAIKTYGGTHNDELLNSQIANLSIAGIDLYHLINNDDYPNPQPNSQPGSRLGDSPNSQPGSRLGDSPNSPIDPRLESFISGKIGKILASVSSAPFLDKKVDLLVRALECTSSACSSFKTAGLRSFSDTAPIDQISDSRKMSIDQTSDSCEKSIDGHLTTTVNEHLDSSLPTSLPFVLENPSLTDSFHSSEKSQSTKVHDSSEKSQSTKVHDSSEKSHSSKVHDSSEKSHSSKVHDSSEKSESTKIHGSSDSNSDSDIGSKLLKAETEKFIGADLLLPIYIYAIIKSNPLNLFTNCKMIELFYPKSLVGPFQSYCLTTTFAAIMYLQNVSLSELGIESHSTQSGLPVDTIETSAVKDVPSNNSYILGEIPNFFMRVPIVSNVGSIGYGIVSGVAGSGIRAAAGVYDAVVNRTPPMPVKNDSQSAEPTDSPLVESSHAQPQTGSSRQDGSRHVEQQTGSSRQYVSHHVEQQTDSSRQDVSRHVEQDLEKRVPNSILPAINPHELVNMEFVGKEYKDLRVGQVQELLESYQKLAMFVMNNS
ncbi:hypothetical protein AYI68_g6428 [Smittium mucronatum]|uniref:VPS9 domain-containing protein n=1 Tax=Smittium mucronatum TaxID=133383 RepID=A0A1R0GRH8_9FUNG|nr:hypothetical protein AYI68_g6428 [Smittium mucronatum]